MVELIFVACLSVQPDRCQEQSLLFADVSPMTCMMGAQIALADWISRHPQYTIASWSCELIQLGEKDT